MAILSSFKCQRYYEKRGKQFQTFILAFQFNTANMFLDHSCRNLSVMYSLRTKVGQDDKQKRSPLINDEKFRDTFESLMY